MLDNAKNFAKVTVSTGYDAAATTVVLTTGHGAKLPVEPFNAVWWNSTDYADPADDPNVEIVRITARSTDSLTVTRAQEGTSASTKNTAGKTYKMIAGMTAKVLNNDLTDPRFGTGADGAVVFDGSSTVLGMAPSGNVYILTRDIYPTTMVVNNGVTIQTASYLIACSVSLTNNGTISNDGGAGGAGSGQTGGTAGAATVVHTFAASIAGKAGANGGSGTTQAGVAGTAGGAANPSATGVNGTAGGAGGRQSQGQGAGGGAGSATSESVTGKDLQYGGFTPTANNTTTPSPLITLNGATSGTSLSPSAGSGSGGSGSVENSGAYAGGGGGGSGASGGIIGIWAATLTNNGAIQAKGGAGGNGGNGSGTPGYNCGGGGGGGGSGGLIYLVYKSFSGNNPDVSGGTGGTGGSGQAPNPISGANGTAGNAGVYFKIIIS